MLDQSIFDFLIQLQTNNNREWFAENKKQFLLQEQKVKSFFGSVYSKLETVDSIEKIQIFRIYRDVRFSKDKSPYKNHFSVGFSRTKPMLRGGMYLHIENEASFIGGGFWAPNTDDLFRIRKEIELDATELQTLISAQSFKSYFKKGIEGEELKTAPKGFDKNHEAIALIRKKQFLVTRNFTNKEVLAPEFSDEVLKTFVAMRPFFDYMSDVLTTDLNGESLY